MYVFAFLSEDQSGYDESLANVEYGAYYVSEINSSDNSIDNASLGMFFLFT